MLLAQEADRRWYEVRQPLQILHRVFRCQCLTATRHLALTYTLRSSLYLRGAVDLDSLHWLVHEATCVRLPTLPIGAVNETRDRCDKARWPTTKRPAAGKHQR